jgi:hypothetical protein
MRKSCRVDLLLKLESLKLRPGNPPNVDRDNETETEQTQHENGHGPAGSKEVISESHEQDHDAVVNEPEEEDAENGALLDEIDKLCDRDEESDSEDAPDWMFDEGEVQSGDPDYVFCPAPHRKQILHLFTKHFCQHPIFPERNGTHQSADEIRTNAVKEMYQFCWQQGL